MMINSSVKPAISTVLQFNYRVNPLLVVYTHLFKSFQLVWTGMKGESVEEGRYTRHLSREPCSASTLSIITIK